MREVVLLTRHAAAQIRISLDKAEEAVPGLRARGTVPGVMKASM